LQFISLLAVEFVRHLPLSSHDICCIDWAQLIDSGSAATLNVPVVQFDQHGFEAIQFVLS
jgi:hypothetical protein